MSTVSRLVVLSFILSLSALVGCATMRGETALRRGNYQQAIAAFEETLSRDPDRIDALLGSARYKLAAYDEAIGALGRAIARDPGNATAHLYLALSHLARRADGLAQADLTALHDLRLHPRTAAQVERALQVLRAGPLTDEMRSFIMASLDDEAEWAQDVEAARREAAPFGPGGPSAVIFVPARPR